MGLSGALFASVSGLDATGTAISVIGDNIANVNTPGFKGRRAEFVDVLREASTMAAAHVPENETLRQALKAYQGAAGAISLRGVVLDLDT